MKHTLIRLIAIMTLAGSMSAFATSEKAKSSATENTNATASDSTTCPCTPEEQAASVKAQNKKDGERQRQILEQEKQWEHDLHNITAG